ncbi:MAG: dihydrolipoyl dehydrogenase [Tepidisphaerales bacterium]
MPTSTQKSTHTFDLIVIGGGPAGYAAAIRAGQLGMRVFCVEKENLGGICLNWGCIPTKALLEDGAFIRKLRNDAPEHGVLVDNLRIDFKKIVNRSRGITLKLQRGVGSLFAKYNVKHEMGVGQIVAPHKVKITNAAETKEISAENILIATGARAAPLPFAPFDGQKIISYREAMTLPKQPRRLAIIGAGAIGCEFADFYEGIGTEVSIVEMLPHLLPNEDDDVSTLLERAFVKRGLKLFLKTRTEKIESTADGVRLFLSGDALTTIDADAVLVAAGVTGNTENVVASSVNVEVLKNRFKVGPDYRTSVPNIYAAGDCIAFDWPSGHPQEGVRHPDLAHIAHHEAVSIVEHLAGHEAREIDYAHAPACTYTHPQVASLGPSEKKLREQGRQIRVGKFPFSASGRALAAGETDGFVKLIFDAKYGELLGVHMIGENVTEMLSELVVARNLEATEAEIIESIHPHPTMSEGIMEAAGVSVSKAIHL